MSVGGSLKSLLSFGLPMGKLLAVGLIAKWRSGLPRTCLYSKCECERQSKIVTFVRTSYGEVVGSPVKTRMAIEFLPYMPIQHM